MCVCAHVSASGCPQSPEEDGTSPGAVVTRAWGTPAMGA